MDTSNPSQPKGKRSGLREKADSLGREVCWISLSAKDDAKPFGSTRGGETVLNNRGKALAASWRELGSIRPTVEPDALVIGPRGLQGILLLSTRKKDAVTVSEVVKLFKVLSSLRLAQLGKTSAALRNMPGTAAPSTGPSAARGGQAPPALWKKGFTEKPISGSAELAEARKALKGLQAR
ncbi:MAG: hypothetical protein JWO30_673 [Fibrobacteres bacterium]|nr:hypothetical protein [Fibrobacterota bacterium]